MKLLAVVLKEALVLARDRAGLLLVVLMPTALAVIVTLIQEDALQAMKGRASPVLLVDDDEGDLGEHLAEALEASGSFTVGRDLDGAPVDATACQEAAAAGRVQVCLVLPTGASDAILRRADHRVEPLRPVIPEIIIPPCPGRAPPGPPAPPPAKEETDDPDPVPTPPDAPEVQVFFDPAARAMYRKALANGVRQALVAEETRALLTALAPRDDAADDAADDDLAAKATWTPGDLVTLVEASPTQAALPSSVEQNIPAWTLFAMFFIVVPLSGSIIQDREQGTLARLRTLPVSPVTLLLGRMIVYVAVCLAQGLLMAALGRWALPALGTSTWSVAPDVVAPLLVAALCAALGATGLGVLLGSVTRSRVQAGVLGSTFTVIASALGGIMVPTALMPDSLRPVARFSPLNWGQEAFLDLTLRGAPLDHIAPDLGRLVALAVVSLLAAAWVQRRHE